MDLVRSMAWHHRQGLISSFIRCKTDKLRPMLRYKKLLPVIPTTMVMAWPSSQETCLHLLQTGLLADDKLYLVHPVSKQVRMGCLQLRLQLAQVLLHRQLASRSNTCGSAARNSHMLATKALRMLVPRNHSRRPRGPQAQLCPWVLADRKKLHQRQSRLRKAASAMQPKPSVVRLQRSPKR